MCEGERNIRGNEKGSFGRQSYEWLGWKTCLVKVETHSVIRRSEINIDYGM
jgi:hypothetical protein